MLAHHELQHRIGRDRRRAVEVFVEAERQPGVGRPRCRSLERRLVPDLERQLEPVKGTLDRRLRHLAVSLAGVTVAGGEERSVDRDRQQEPRAGDELLAVDVPPEARGGPVEWTPGSGGGMPRTPGKGRSSTSRPNWSTAYPASTCSFQLNITPSPTLTPSSSFSGVCQPPANVAPHVPTLTSSMRTSSVCPAFAPRTSIGPIRAWPSSS